MKPTTENCALCHQDENGETGIVPPFSPRSVVNIVTVDSSTSNVPDTLDKTLASVLPKTLEETEISNLSWLWRRVHVLSRSLKQMEQNDKSAIIDACCASLTVQMRTLLHRLRLLSDFQDSIIDGSHMAWFGRLRSSYELTRATRYLDLIETGSSDLNCREDIDARLQEVLTHLASQGVPCLTSKCCISPWSMSQLSFCVPAGLSAQAKIPACNGSLPLNIQIEPFYQLRVNDLVMDRVDLEKITACQVQFQKCTHRQLSAGSTVRGEACIRFHISPIGHRNQRVEFEEKDVEERISIQGAKVLQENSFPPAPETSADLYTSSVYGDAATSVTLVVKTASKQGETPCLKIAIFL